MCGFAGEYVFGGGVADVNLACAMAERLAHRGPDEDGRYVSPDGKCAIGFRRLAVIDVEGSHQPMTRRDGELAVAFNGEVYNFQELRVALQSGFEFTTAGDTEVLLALYERYGVDVAEHLRGMFAFVIYDAASGRLMMVRDRLGQKPLWYSELGDRIVFASEAKAVLAHPGVSGSADAVALTYYLTMGYVPAPQSAFAGVRKIRPGCRMLVTDRPGPQEPYWQPQALPLPKWRDQVCRGAGDAIAAAVTSRMVSEVPLGALLSGGVDSSIIVALMAKAAGKGGGIRTFTAGFAEQLFDERSVAAEVAAHCRTDHTELLIEPVDTSAVEAVLSMYDEPFGDSSALPTYLICRAAREHVTVALAGDGGDEAFAGYDRHRAMHLGQSMGAGKYLAVRLAGWAAGPLAGRDEKNRWRRLVRFAGGLPYPPAIQYFMYRRLFGPNDLRRLLTDELLAAVDVEAPARWFCELYEQEELQSELVRAQRHDMMTYLPDDLLVKTDIASMASSLELRAPMVDHDVVAWGLSLPVEMKLKRWRGKVVLDELFGNLLPASVFQRRKQGFAVPISQWLRGPLLETMKDTLLDRGVAKAGILRREAIIALINDHLSGRADFGHHLWALLSLGRWLLAR